MSKEILNHLEVIQQRLLGVLPKRLRLIFSSFKFAERGLIVTGPRGVGKTTLVLSKIDPEKFLYVSCDNPLTATISLWDLANQAFMSGYQGIIFDEVHFAKNWSVHVKAIYDSFPKKCIWLLDSSTIALHKGMADLSRRFITYRLPLLSLREYVFLREGLVLPKLDPFNLHIEQVNEVLNTLPILKFFKQYMTEGFRPFFLEGSYQERLHNILNKVLQSDVPLLIPDLNENNLRLLQAIVGYLAQSKIPTLNISKMCSEWSIGKEKLYVLLTVMDSVELIKIVRKQGDTKTHSKGAKIFFFDPSMYYLFNAELGNLREAFVVSAFANAGFPVFAHVDETKGDYCIGQKNLEIGGRKKSAKKSDYVVRDDVEVPTKNTIPLWTLGMQL